MKRLATDREKIFAKDMFYKVLVSKIYKELLKFSSKTTTKLKKNGPKTSIDTSPKKVYRWQLSI